MRQSTFHLCWTSDDGRAELSAGTFPTLEAAKAAKPEAERRFVDQGSGPLEGGSWVIEERGDETGPRAVRRYELKVVGGAADWWVI